MNEATPTTRINGETGRLNLQASKSEMGFSKLTVRNLVLISIPLLAGANSTALRSGSEAVGGRTIVVSPAASNPTLLKTMTTDTLMATEALPAVDNKEVGQTSSIPTFRIGGNAEKPKRSLTGCFDAKVSAVKEKDTPENGAKLLAITYDVEVPGQSAIQVTEDYPIKLKVGTSKLRKALKPILGRNLTDVEIDEGLLPSDLIGRPCSVDLKELRSVDGKPKFKLNGVY
jgi:hypothetical protein